jgi:hypothetical protein
MYLMITISIQLILWDLLFNLQSILLHLKCNYLVMPNLMIKNTLHHYLIPMNFYYLIYKIKRILQYYIMHVLITMKKWLNKLLTIMKEDQIIWRILSILLLMINIHLYILHHIVVIYLYLLYLNKKVLI